MESIDRIRILGASPQGLHLHAHQFVLRKTRYAAHLMVDELEYPVLDEADADKGAAMETAQNLFRAIHIFRRAFICSKVANNRQTPNRPPRHTTTGSPGTAHHACRNKYYRNLGVEH